ncbi:branched-chain amino acid ABC transporter permease [Natronocalculus amylovorans]|uniref:Branched-chain amino acid ABC transporter permease n=1 Tax=Natronocalculus amylovorans TaxID=2917812 RepID=A0AAE3FZQ4_9EURY|nr:branched-chain amino acid ABC transporter permease [Natronocalculus amylovorans]MCL9817865.1 branched-chain amino acid ABC transporter permease [Natronocalculus amylovorans]NUE03200.1 branched-chain amino acid ABC transporter permease [Halorubraceae archaeon YAN]
MGVTESRRLDRHTIREQAPLILVGVFGALLLVDLLFRLAGVEIALTANRSFGGSLSAQRFGGMLWNGIVIGLIIGLAGIGLSMTYSILSFANFSHGDLLTSGAFAGWAASYVVAGFGVVSVGELLFVRAGGGAPFADEIGASIVQAPLSILVGMVVAAGVTILLALAIDRIVYKPMRGRGGISLLIASIGVALALRYIIQFMFGASNRGVVDTTDVRVDIAGLSVNLHEVTLVVAAVALMLGMHFMLQRTKLGKAMRAMADNQDLALVTGIPTERIVQATWVIGGGLAGVAGYLVVLDRGTIGFNLGWFLLLLIFAAVILGGIGSIYGAIAGGLLIGITYSVSLVWIPSDFNEAAAFALMILVLLLRPEGIFSGVSTA